MLRKLLRTAGLALILMPEPFTTPFGLALLGLSSLFARLNRIDTPGPLRGLIRMYLNEARLRGRTQGVIVHKLKQTLSDLEWRYRPQPEVPADAGRRMLRLGKGMKLEFAEPAVPIVHSIKNNWGGYVWPGAPPDIRVTPSNGRIVSTSHLTPRVRAEVYHLPPGKTAARARTTVPVSRYGTESIFSEKVIYHSLRNSLGGYVLPSVPMQEKPVLFHRLNKDMLIRQYGRTKPDVGAAG